MCKGERVELGRPPWLPRRRSQKKQLEPKWPHAQMCRSCVHVAWIRSHVESLKPELSWWRQHADLIHGNVLADTFAAERAAEIQTPSIVAY